MFRISAYELLLSTVYFDNDTVAPTKGDEYRNERMAYIDGELFSLKTDPEFVTLMEEINRREDLDDTRKRIIRWQLKDLEAIRNVPKELYVEFSQLSMESMQVWEKAKNADDYKLFAPYLLKVIDMTKKMLTYRKSDLEGYDILLSDFEPGMTREKYDEFFSLIKKELVPLIKEISTKKKINTASATPKIAAITIITFVSLSPSLSSSHFSTLDGSSSVLPASSIATSADIIRHL